MSAELRKKAKGVLSETFGFDSYREGQEEAIMSALQQRHSLVMLPTGTGKTLCYQLPSYLLEGTTLIISPLLSLMEDQVDKMKSNGEKSVVALNSFLSFSEKKNILSRLSSYKFVFLSPEMLQQPAVLNYFKSLTISLLVIDEAHCISQWGMDFRPDYLKLGDIRHALGDPLTMALTATAVEKVREAIISVLGIATNLNEIIYPVDRPSIQLRVIECYKNKDEELLHAISEFKGPGIIYFTSKKLADQTAEMIRVEKNIKVESYHSDLTKEDKRKVQSQFLNNTLSIICATSAFGMGIDKPDIRFVIHYHLPASPEMYLQEIGRCSRDKKGGVALLLYEKNDEMIQKRLQQDTLPAKEELTFAYRHPGKLDDLKEDSKTQLCRYFINQRVPLEDAWETIREYELNKHYQLRTMVNYAVLTSCKRTILLNYFNEEADARRNGCCSFCTHSLPLPYNPEEPELAESNIEKIWQDKVKLLFNLQR
ncbi:MAG: ATP-dependent DNA helicase RecQ [Alkalibacterium sp.]|nr:ATP-dependent DNA helicase RecQ [Alkalibacterium sp.]